MFDEFKSRQGGKFERTVQAILSVLSYQHKDEHLVAWYKTAGSAANLARRVSEKHPLLNVKISPVDDVFLVTIKGDATMIITKVTISVNELRKTAEYENQRFEATYEASIEPGESVKDVEDALIKQGKEAIDKFFEEDPDDLKREIRKYRKQFGRL